MKSTKVFEVHRMEPGENFKKNTHIWGAMAKRFFQGEPTTKPTYPLKEKAPWCIFKPQKESSIWRTCCESRNSRFEVSLKQLPTSGHISRPFVFLGLLDQVQLPRLARETPVLLVDFHRIVNFQTYKLPNLLFTNKTLDAHPSTVNIKKHHIDAVWVVMRCLGDKMDHYKIAILICSHHNMEG